MQSTTTTPGSRNNLEPQAAAERITNAIRSVIAIEPRQVEDLLVALLARGHALIEGIPGTGKTLLSRTLAASIDCDFARIQFTNDLMPSDIVGTTIYRQKTEEFQFVRGPLFHNIVLADEVNRTSPRTLSCLLEAMENGCVSVDGKTESLADPFLVLATRNPIEFHGTYPIPEAALDRFLVRIELSYPDQEQEVTLYLGDQPEQRLAALRPVLDRQGLLALMAQVHDVVVREAVARYALRVVVATRQHDSVLLGASPRAAMAWLHAARALALLSGRRFVLPDDLQRMAEPVLAHRIFLHGSGDAGQIVRQTIDEVAVEL